MPRARVAVEIQFNRFAEIAAKLPRETGEVVQRTLLAIETRAKLIVPVDTGALRASITTEMETQTSGVCYTPQEYAHFVELGTTRMAARPYFTPATEAARGPFLKEMSDLESRLG
jgi:hypothetical protein